MKLISQTRNDFTEVLDFEGLQNLNSEDKGRPSSEQSSILPCYLPVFQKRKTPVGHQQGTSREKPFVYRLEWFFSSETLGSFGWKSVHLHCDSSVIGIGMHDYYRAGRHDKNKVNNLVES